jgi:hypothetical protein
MDILLSQGPYKVQTSYIIFPVDENDKPLLWEGVD